MFIGNYCENENNLKNICEIYSLDMKELGNKSIEITKFNTNYFNVGKDLLMYSYLIFEDFKQDCLSKNKIIGIIDFLKYSVNNNNYLCDYLEKCKFNIFEDTIVVKKSKALKKDNKYEILGEFYFDNYKFIFTSGSYYFIESLFDESEQYFYYGD